MDMTDTRADRPPRTPGGDPAAVPPTATIADDEPTRTTGRPRLRLVGMPCPSHARPGRKPDLRVVAGGASGAPDVVHSMERGDGRAGSTGRVVARSSGYRGELRLVGREAPDLRRLVLLAPAAPRGAAERAPLAADAGMRDDASGAAGAAGLTGGYPTPAGLRDALEMERPL